MKRHKHLCCCTRVCVCVCLCVYEHFGGRGGLRRMLRAGSGLGGGSREMRPF